MKPTLYMMVGLPGSGKSTYANYHPEATVVSTDSIREELYGSEAVQGNGRKVFEIAYRRIVNALMDDKNVIFDATNVVKRNRIDFLNRFSKLAVCVAVVVDTPIETCVARNAARTRKVPEYVIYNMNRKFIRPNCSEGWDRIEIVKNF